MTKTVLTVATILAAGMATACMAAGNPLIGKWKYTGKGYVDREGTSYCGEVTEMQFTPREETRWSPATASKPASRDTQPVNYLVNGDKVYVSSTQAFGSGQYWNFLGKREIQSDTMAQCVFDKE